MMQTRLFLSQTLGSMKGDIDRKVEKKIKINKVIM